MPRLPMRTIDDTAENTRASLAAAEKNNGYLPNLLRILANAPVALDAYLTVSSINARSSQHTPLRVNLGGLSRCPPPRGVRTKADVRRPL